MSSGKLGLNSLFFIVQYQDAREVKGKEQLQVPESLSYHVLVCVFFTERLLPKPPTGTSST